MAPDGSPRAAPVHAPFALNSLAFCKLLCFFRAKIAVLLAPTQSLLDLHSANRWALPCVLAPAQGPQPRTPRTPPPRRAGLPLPLAAVTVLLHAAPCPSDSPRPLTAALGAPTPPRFWLCLFWMAWRQEHWPGGAGSPAAFLAGGGGAGVSACCPDQGSAGSATALGRGSPPALPSTPLAVRPPEATTGAALCRAG